MQRRGWGEPSREHEQVYHAASRCQAAALSLTPRRLHDLRRTCSVEGQKTGGLASPRPAPLRGSGSMVLLGGFKRGSLVGALRGPHSLEHPQPQVGEGADGHRMTFAVLPLSMVDNSAFSPNCLTILLNPVYAFF